MNEQVYGVIINNKLQTSYSQLECYKPLVYAEIPEFDQATQYVVQSAPVDRGEDIYFGVEVLTLLVDNNYLNFMFGL